MKEKRSLILIFHWKVCLFLWGLLSTSGHIHAENFSPTSLAEQGSVVGEFASDKYCVLENVPYEYEKYNVAPWALLKLPEFKRAYWQALKPIRNKKLTPYLQNLEVVWSSSSNVACITPEGLAIIYIGSKPKWATDSLKIVFLPDSKLIGMQVTDEFVKYQNGYFGKKSDVISRVLNGSVCNSRGK